MNSNSNSNSNEVPLLEALLEYHNEGNLILSMPGNKCGLGFERDIIGMDFVSKLGYLDITEVDPLDNLHHPEGVIKEAQELLCEYYGVKKAFFMVNGSTGGNLSAIFSAFNEGDEVLVERNCHKSIYNALVLKKLKVTYIEPLLDLKNEIFLSPNRKSIENAFKKCENPKGIILTYPNYFGITYDIEEVICNLKEKGLKVIIDSAHGAHFDTDDRLPKSLARIGDYVVLSAHKTLPSLTGGSYLLVNCEDDNIEFYVSTFMTTSPSYLIMASLDYGRYYLSRYGKEDYNILIDLAEEWKEKINKLGKVNIIGRESLEEGYDIDLTRYVMVLPKGYSGHKLLEYLRKEKIQSEMSFSLGVVLILSPFNKEKDFLLLYRAIKRLDLESLKIDYIKMENKVLIPKKALEPYEVFNSASEYVKLSDCEGKIAKESLIPYPPGIPLVCSGEIISREIISLIERDIEEGKTVIGIKEGKVNIVCDFK